MKKNRNYQFDEDNDILVAELPCQEDGCEQDQELNFWLMENLKIMEKLTVKEPVSWSEQDWGG